MPPCIVMSCNVVLFVTHNHINGAFKSTSDSALTSRSSFGQKVGGIDKKPALTWRTTAQFDAGCPILSALWPARATNRHQLLAKRAVAGSTWSERASTNAPGRVRAEMRRGAPFARQPCMARQVLAGALAAQFGRRGPLPWVARLVTHICLHNPDRGEHTAGRAHRVAKVCAHLRLARRKSRQTLAGRVQKTRGSGAPGAATEQLSTIFC